MTVDLGGNVQVDRLVVKHAGSGGESAGYNTVDYVIESADSLGGPWANLVTVTGNTASQTQHVIATTSTRFLRLYITKGDSTASDNIVRLYELEAFGPVVESDSSEALLASLSGSAGTLAPAFDPDVRSYDVSAGYRTESYTVTAVPRHAGATVAYNGSASPTVPLAVGDNTIVVVVTAQDGTTQEGYTLNVSRTVDRSALATALAEVSKLDAQDYTVSSWNALLAVVGTPATGAQAVLADPDATQDQADKAVTDVLAAIANLDERGELGELKALVAVTEVMLATEGLDEQSASALAVALASARAVVAAGSDRTQADLDATFANLLALLGQAKTTGIKPPKEIIKAVPAQVAATKVKLHQPNLTLVKGKSYRVVAGVYYTGAYPSYNGGALTWKSSNPKVAKVRTDGKITALKAGKVKITATAKKKSANGKAVKATLTLTVVKKKPKAKVKKVSSSVPKSMTVGQVKYLTPKYQGKAAAVKVTYKTTKYSIVSVDKAGRLTAVKKGVDWVVIKAGKRTAKYKVTVR
jgi:hypothetical protein